MKRACVVLLATLTLHVATANATTIYVNATTGNDAWSGLCEVWDGGTCGPKATIQAAIDVAPNGSTVLVADGIYTGFGNVGIDFGGRPITLQSTGGPDNCIIDCGQLNRGFYFHTSETTASIVDGFTITNGYASNGGGVYCLSASPTLVNCHIVGNRAWGTVPGVGIGGGIHSVSAGPVLIDCEILDNVADRDGGGAYFLIGPPRLLGCSIRNNHADGNGGGLVFRAPAELANCVIEGNSALLDGGGLVSYADSPSFVSCVVRDNEARSGAGILLLASQARLTNMIVSGNRATQWGGAVYIEDPSNPPSFVNSLFVGNRALIGGALYPTDGGRVEFENSIFRDNLSGTQLGSGLSLGNDGYLYLAYCNVQGGQSGVDIFGTYSEFIWDAGMFDADPLFVADGVWDDAGTPGDPSDDFWIEGDYHVSVGSPCIDAGSNSAILSGSPVVLGDFDGFDRRIEHPDVPDSGEGTPPIVDVGPYEAWPDCNTNGVPDHDDIGDGTSQDLNGDGIPDECEPKLHLVSDVTCTGDQLVVRVSVSDVLGVDAVVGGQFRLWYDDTRLTFISADPASAVFTELLYQYANGDTVDVGVGVGPDPPDNGTLSGTMAVLTFAVADQDCVGSGLVGFRSDAPPHYTRLSAIVDDQMVPITAAELWKVDLPDVTLDVTPPALTIPPGVVVAPGAPTDPSATGWATATDLCDAAPAITYLDEQQGYVIWRTWTATDACGNATQGAQWIRIDVGIPAISDVGRAALLLLLICAGMVLIRRRAVT